MSIGIFTISSPLHNAESIAAHRDSYLKELGFEYIMYDNDFSRYGEFELNLIFILTGGTESIFREKLRELENRGTRLTYFTLLAYNTNNSLAASMEILSFLKNKQYDGEILHGSKEFVLDRVNKLRGVFCAARTIKGFRAGIIGEPSDWLISSTFNRIIVKDRLGVDLVDIPIAEVKEIVEKLSKREDKEAVEQAQKIREEFKQIKICPATEQYMEGAINIYLALKEIVAKYSLNAFTIRCFDLLTAVKNTGCLALAKLNAEGIVAGCEGDVPAMLSMILAKGLSGVSGFQANPAHIDVATGEIKFAHCTIPLNMVESYEFLSHFESGIGVGVRGFMRNGPVTIFKLCGNMERFFAENGTLIESPEKDNFCRTQQLIKLDNPEAARYFLNNPIGNHHIIIPGHYSYTLNRVLEKLINN